MSNAAQGPAAASPPPVVLPPAAGADVSPLPVTYESPSEALEAVRSDFLYWSEKLTDTSLQLSFAVIAANWAVFGSVDRVLGNAWAKYSLFLVLLSLGISLAGSKLMSEMHRSRYEHAEGDPERWKKEFRDVMGKRDPWPFTHGIEFLGRVLRECKTWLPLAGGLLFLIALVLS